MWNDSLSIGVVQCCSQQVAAASASEGATAVQGSPARGRRKTSPPALHRSRCAPNLRGVPATARRGRQGSHDERPTQRREDERRRSADEPRREEGAGVARRALQGLRREPDRRRVETPPRGQCHDVVREDDQRREESFPRGHSEQTLPASRLRSESPSRRTDVREMRREMSNQLRDMQDLRKPESRC